MGFLFFFSREKSWGPIGSVFLEIGDFLGRRARGTWGLVSGKGLDGDEEVSKGLWVVEVSGRVCGAFLCFRRLVSGRSKGVLGSTSCGALVVGDYSRGLRWEWDL